MGRGFIDGFSFLGTYSLLNAGGGERFCLILYLEGKGGVGEEGKKTRGGRKKEREDRMSEMQKFFFFFLGFTYMGTLEFLDFFFLPYIYLLASLQGLGNHRLQPSGSRDEREKKV